MTGDASTDQGRMNELVEAVERRECGDRLQRMRKLAQRDEQAAPEWAPSTVAPWRVSAIVTSSVMLLSSSTTRTRRPFMSMARLPSSR